MIQNNINLVVTAKCRMKIPVKLFSPCLKPSLDIFSEISTNDQVNPLETFLINPLIPKTSIGIGILRIFGKQEKLTKKEDKWEKLRNNITTSTTN
jgi:hypothetical protein